MQMAVGLVYLHGLVRLKNESTKINCDALSAL